jgi:hypothetical protein
MSEGTDSRAGTNVLGAHLPITIQDLKAIFEKIVRVTDEDWVAGHSLEIVLRRLQVFAELVWHVKASH